MKSPILISLLAASLLIAAPASIPAESSTSVDGKTFFHQEVVPQLTQNGCHSCHAVGYLRPNVLVYEELIRRLAIGDSAQNNVVIYKIANTRSITPERPNHPGGQRCATLDAEPCKTIRQWWEIEFGNGAEPMNGGQNP